jgi:integrase
MPLTARTPQTYNHLSFTGEGVLSFMEYGQVKERERYGKTLYWVEIWWGNPKGRYTFTQIPVPASNGLIEWHSCAESKPMAEFLLSIIRGRIKDKTFHPDEFRKKSPMQIDIYLRNWMEIKKPNVGEGDNHVIKWAIEKHLIPHLGSTYILNISKNRLRDLQNKLVKIIGKDKGKPLGLKGKKNVMEVLYRALNDACPEYLPVMPKFPGFKGKESIIPRDIRVPSLEDLLEIFDQIPDRHRHIFYFMAYTGCRPSEARAFRKMDIEKTHIMFVRTFERGEKETNVKGKRPDPGALTEGLKEILKNAPDNIAPLPYRFVNPDTKEHYTSDEVNDLWKDAYKAIGYEYLKMYDCTRHFYATVLLQGGIPMHMVSKAMRHKDIKTTQIYDHSTVIHMAPMIDKVLPFPGKSTVGESVVNTTNDGKS